MTTELSLGATYLGEGRCQFLVWAPLVQRVEVRLMGPQDRIFPLQPGARGYYHGIVEGVAPGSLYRYRLDGERERPDPVSRFQPQGVHGPSQVVDTHFPWDDDTWPGIFLQDYIIYELHVGLFTPEGTLEAVIPFLDELKDLGITAIELMPVAQFPGERNWGYDGAYPFAVQDSYGGPEGLKKLVNACHRKGLAVVLDVVYNHLGPEGNYLGEFGYYFTDHYKTTWGSAFNFDGPYSDEVRRLFIENGVYWITEFHIDALRMDAVHAILDFSAQPFLSKLAFSIHSLADKLNRRIYLIAESALNDTRVIHPPERGGYDLDAQWNDDFHHSLHTVLTGEQSGYYHDFGEFQQLIKAFREGFVYSGEYSPYRRRGHGNSSRDVPAQQFVVFAQNHDQVGNRMLGDRLPILVSFEALKLAACAVLLSPYIPLIFMGEEYGEISPFLYFVSHSDPNLVAAVRKGRREEFQAFQWQGEPPDPQSPETFLRSRLHRENRGQHQHAVLLDFYRRLIQLRKDMPALQHLSKDNLEVSGMEEERLLLMRRWHKRSEALCIMNFNKNDTPAYITISTGKWRKILDSSEERWMGAGSLLPDICDNKKRVPIKPLSAALFEKENTP